MERVKLYKALYCAAMNATAPYWRKDSNRVKEVRDIACSELFKKPYNELTDEELLYVITELNAKTTPLALTKKYATHKQLSLLKSYLLICAIYYCDLEGLLYKNDKGTIYRGEDLRNYLKGEYNLNLGIPNNILRALYERWINLKVNTYLEQAGFRKKAKKPQRFFYEYLKPEEAEYLINRFREIANNLQMQTETKYDIKDMSERMN